MRNKELLLSVAAAFIIVGIIGGTFLLRGDQCPPFNEATVTVGNTTWQVGRAQTDKEKVRGLIGCGKVPVGRGLYFEYPSPTTPTFWMVKMSIPIDIIWINGTEVVAIDANIPPNDKDTVDPPLYKPPRPITAVLEVAAGAAAQSGIVPGSPVGPLQVSN